MIILRASLAALPRGLPAQGGLVAPRAAHSLQSLLTGSTCTLHSTQTSLLQESQRATLSLSRQSMQRASLQAAQSPFSPRWEPHAGLPQSLQRPEAGAPQRSQRSKAAMGFHMTPR